LLRGLDLAETDTSSWRRFDRLRQVIETIRHNFAASWQGCNSRGHSLLHPSRHVRRQAIQDPLSIATITQQSRIPRYCQMPRDFGLRQIKGRSQLANAQLALLHNERERAIGFV
jgi:hypothetical protein